MSAEQVELEPSPSPLDGPIPGVVPPQPFPPPPPSQSSISIFPSPPPPPPSPSIPSPPRSSSPKLPSPSNPSGGEFPRTPSITPGLSPSPRSPSPGGLSKGAVVGITIGGVALLLLMTLLCFLYKKKRRRHHDSLPTPKTNSSGGQQQLEISNASQPSDHVMTPSKPLSPPQQPLPLPPHVMSSNSGSGGSDSIFSDHSVPPPPSPGLGIYQNTFTFEELSRATNGFSEANLLGQGGFGYVFKGILRNGKDIAVKQLKAGSTQGEREFQAEVEIISRVHHKHLVSLVGYCVAGAQRLLVYEFVSNNNLEFHLHGKGQPPMEWSSRLKIAVGSAKALSYLHESCNPKIIHRDIKTSNILIDSKFEAKVADFGLAKIVPDSNTHVTTRIMGSFGYLAPEYAASGKLTEKSDVYSFGVVLLELITGRRPFQSSNDSQDDNLVDWAIPLLNQASEQEGFEVFADKKMNNEYNTEEMARMVACAVACVRHLARQRPSMDQVARVLDGSLPASELKKGIKPAYVTVDEL